MFLLEKVNIKAKAFFQVQSRGFDDVEEYLDGGNLFAFSEMSYVFSRNITKKGNVLLGSLRPQKRNKCFQRIFVDIFIEHIVIVKTELRKSRQQKLAFLNKKTALYEKIMIDRLNKKLYCLII